VDVFRKKKLANVIPLMGKLVHGFTVSGVECINDVKIQAKNTTMDMESPSVGHGTILECFKIGHRRQVTKMICLLIESMVIKDTVQRIAALSLPRFNLKIVENNRTTPRDTLV